MFPCLHNVGFLILWYSRNGNPEIWKIPEEKKSLHSLNSATKHLFYTFFNFDSEETSPISDEKHRRCNEKEDTSAVFPFRNDSGQRVSGPAMTGLLRWSRRHCCGCWRWWRSSCLLGDLWDARDLSGMTFGIEFLASFRWNRGFWRTFIWFIYLYIHFIYIHLTACLATSRCGMSKDAADQWVRVTEWLSSVAVRAPSMTLTKMVRQFVLGLAHTCRAHRAQAIHFIHTMPRKQSSLWSSGVVITEMYAVYCYVHLCDRKPGCFFNCCSLQIPSTVTILFTFLYTQTELMNSWQITWWWRSTVAALTCGCRSYLAAPGSLFGPTAKSIQSPGIIDMYTCIRIDYISLHIYVYIYVHICMIYAHCIIIYIVFYFF